MAVQLHLSIISSGKKKNQCIMISSLFTLTASILINNYYFFAVFIVNLEICVQILSYSVLQKRNTEPLITVHNIIFTYEPKTFDNTSLSDVGCQHVNLSCAYITILVIHKCIPL